MNWNEPAIQTRLQVLEKHNRWLCAVNITLLIAFGAFLLCGAAGQPSSNTLVATAVNVVDDAGNVRLSLGTTEGLPHLFLYDSGNRLRYSLATEKVTQMGRDFDHTTCQFYTTNGDAGLTMHAGVVKLSGTSGGQGQATLTPGNASFQSAGGEQYISVETYSDRSPQVMLVGKNANISLLESPGTTMAILGAASLESTRTGAAEHLTPGSLLLFNRDGVVLERLP